MQSGKPSLRRNRMYHFSMDHVSTRWARDHWRETLDRVEHSRQPLTLDYYGSPVVVLLPVSVWSDAVNLWLKLANKDISQEAQEINVTNIRHSWMTLRRNAESGLYTKLKRWGVVTAIAVSPAWFDKIQPALELINSFDTKE